MELESLLTNIPYYDASLSIVIFSTMAVIMKRLPRKLVNAIEKNNLKSLIKFTMVLLIGVGVGCLYFVNNLFPTLEEGIITGLVSAVIASGLRDGVKNITQTNQTVIQHNPINTLPH